MSSRGISSRGLPKVGHHLVTAYHARQDAAPGSDARAKPKLVNRECSSRPNIGAPLALLEEREESMLESQRSTSLSRDPSLLVTDSLEGTPADAVRAANETGPRMRQGGG
jgi:hypothetical protein